MFCDVFVAQTFIIVPLGPAQGKLCFALCQHYDYIVSDELCISRWSSTFDKKKKKEIILYIVLLLSNLWKADGRIK